jgi:hypothetical protein
MDCHAVRIPGLKAEIHLSIMTLTFYLSQLGSASVRSTDPTKVFLNPKLLLLSPLRILEVESKPYLQLEFCLSGVATFQNQKQSKIRL